MTTWQSGRSTQHIEDIIAGKKTVEGRLNRDKFSLYKPGDVIHLREDIYDDNGKLIKSIPNRVTIQVIKIEKFKDFRSMLTAVGIDKVLPRAKNLKEAIAEYRKYYGSEDELNFGVLAIYIKPIG